MLVQMQGCTHFTSTLDSAGVFAFPEKLCLCKEKSGFDPGVATYQTFNHQMLVTLKLFAILKPETTH